MIFFSIIIEYLAGINKNYLDKFSLFLIVLSQFLIIVTTLLHKIF